MDTLADSMGISKRTIYENFRDKDTLLLEVITYFKDSRLRQAREILEQSENVIVALFQLLERMINNMKQLNPLFFHDAKKYHSRIFTRMQEKGDLRDHSITRMILKQGVGQGIFRPEHNMEVVNLTLHELFNLFSPDSILTSEGYHRGELFNNIIIPYLRGISTTKGMKLIDKHGAFKY